MFRGSSVSTIVHCANLVSVHRDVWMVNGPVIARGSERGIDMRDVGAVLLPTSELVWSNGRVHDSVIDHFDTMSRDSRDHRTSVYFMVYWRLLYDVGYIIGCCVSGFASRGATSVPFQRGHCAMKPVRRKLISNIGFCRDATSSNTEEGSDPARDREDKLTEFHLWHPKHGCETWHLLKAENLRALPQATTVWVHTLWQCFSVQPPA